MSFNKIILVGNLGKDPELRYTPQGKAVCSFSMATTEKRRDAEPQTIWFKVTTWGHTAEAAAKYLTKGTPVYIEGRLRIEEWTDRENKQRYTLDVQASDMQFISGGGRDSDRLETPAEEQRSIMDQIVASQDDDIPF
jgi:single-strand DNA-binding protein